MHRVLSIIIIFLLLSNCKENIQEKKITKNEVTHNSVLIIDASASMLSIEFKPNRLEKIKTLAEKIIKSKASKDSISIIVFSQNSKILCNLSNDKNKLLSALKNINDKTYMSLGEGTNFENAIEKSINELKMSNNKSIFLFTDGVYANKNDKSKNSIQIEKLKLKKIKTNVVVIATNDIYYPPINKDANGNLVFNEQKSPQVDGVFSVLTKETNGTFIRLFNENEVNQIDISSFYKKNR